MSILLKGVTLIGNKQGSSSKNNKIVKQMNVAKSITDNAAKLNQKYRKSLENNESSDGSNSSGGSSDSSGGSSDGSSSSSGSSSISSSMSKSERQKLYKMKDSNVPYYYDHDENDLMYLAASEKKDYAWGLKEEVFLYTMHDRQKHRYITSFNIDSDANDIVTTCQIDMPYRDELMDYYIPGKTVFMIIGGVYDREVLFIGRVSEVNQQGDSIQVVGQNIGWKFKQYMPIKFYKKIRGLPVPLVVKAIFKQLGFTGGKYHMDLWAIPNVFKYKLDEDCTVKYKGQTVQNVPELTEVVKRMKESDINEYVATRAKVRSTQEAADAHEAKTLTKLSAVWKSSTSGYSSSYRKNYGIKTSINKDGEVEYDPLEDRLLGANKKVEYFTYHNGGYSEYTYEDVMNNIAAAIDAQFFIVDTTVCFVSFNAMMAMSSSETIVKAIQPRIEYWQLMHDSFELDVNQYGFYNTVIIKYKNGTVKRSFEDLVRVYDEIPITYEEPDLNYEGAQLKAQAYLAAHVRDFGMQIRITILYTGKITVGSFIKVQNPLTMSESLLYVYGISVQWSADNQTIIADLDLRYGPENPDNPEIPEYGQSYIKSSTASSQVTGKVSANVSEATAQITNGLTDPDAKAEAIYDWFAKNIQYRFYYESDHSMAETLQGRSSNCYDAGILAYNMFTAAGVQAKFCSGTLSTSGGTWGHYWVEILYKGKWEKVDVGRVIKRGIGKNVGSYTGRSVQKQNF